MKKFYLKYVINLFVIVFLSISCSKETDSVNTKDPDDNGDVIETPFFNGYAKNLKSYAGHNRVKLTFEVSSDSIEYFVLSWDNKGAELLEKKINKNEANAGIFEVVIDGLIEGIHNFDILAYDKTKSPAKSTRSTRAQVYGASYISSLHSRVVKETIFIYNQDPIINWLEARPEEIAVDIFYTNKTGNQDTIRMIHTEDSVTLPGYLKNTDIKYRSLYLPTNTSIDTFYTAVKTIPSLRYSIGMKVASFNIRLDTDTGINAWANRKKPVTDLILRHDFDIVGIQEPRNTQIPDFDNMLNGYTGVTAPYAIRSFIAIYYKKELYEMLESGHFWLSETPDIPSIGWDADELRVCQWAKFRDKETNREFYVFNSHFYWRLKIARENSGPLVARKIEEITGDLPVVFVGDLNSRPTESQSEKLRALLNDAFFVTEAPRKGPENTNLGGGNFQGEPVNRIDYIYVSKDIKVLDYTCHDDMYIDKNGDYRYPSDHLPISSNIIIK